MTEHTDINQVGWPHTRFHRRLLAKQLGFTCAAAERAYAAQQAAKTVTLSDVASRTIADTKAENSAISPIELGTRAHEAVMQAIEAGTLPTADFVGNQPPPVSIAVKNAAGVPVGGGAIREGGEPVFLAIDGGITAREDQACVANGKPVQLGVLLSPQEVEALVKSCSKAVEDLEHEYNLRELVLRQAKELRIAQDVILEDGRRLNAARTYLHKLEDHCFAVEERRDDWRTTLWFLVLGASVACAQAGGLWIAAAIGAVCTVAYHHYKDRQQDKARPVHAPWMHPAVPKPVQACTDDLCHCTKTPCDQPDVCGCDGFVADDAHMAGCGHAPSSPFNVPGVLPETPQVVVGDNDKETK